MPSSKLFSSLEFQKTTVKEEIDLLINQKDKMESSVNSRISLWQKSLLGISLAHIISFYFMIFHVEWLGWDIIEPITYTVDQLTLLLALRFFIKYRTDREYDTMIEEYTKRALKSGSKALNYSHILQILSEKRKELKQINAKMGLLRTITQRIK